MKIQALWQIASFEDVFTNFKFVSYFEFCDEDFEESSQSVILSQEVRGHSRSY